MRAVVVRAVVARLIPMPAFVACAAVLCADVLLSLLLYVLLLGALFLCRRLLRLSFFLPLIMFRVLLFWAIRLCGLILRLLMFNVPLLSALFCCLECAVLTNSTVEHLVVRYAMDVHTFTTPFLSMSTALAQIVKNSYI